MGTQNIEVEIPKELYDKISLLIKGTSHKSVENYIVSKLEIDFPIDPVYTKEEEKLIKERLRRLGYIE